MFRAALESQTMHMDEVSAIRRGRKVEEAISAVDQQLAPFGIATLRTGASFESMPAAAQSTTTRFPSAASKE